jgi:hypothetical protein
MRQSCRQGDPLTGVGIPGNAADVRAEGALSGELLSGECLHIMQGHSAIVGEDEPIQAGTLRKTGGGVRPAGNTPSAGPSTGRCDGAQARRSARRCSSEGARTDQFSVEPKLGVGSQMKTQTRVAPIDDEFVRSENATARFKPVFDHRG